MVVSRSRLLWVICAIALAVRIVPLGRRGLAWAFWYDSDGYVEMAAGLKQGCGFARAVDHSCSAPEIVRTPGYPAFLALFPSLRDAIVAQSVLGALACLAISALLERRFGNRAAILGGLLLALDIPTIHASTQLLTDSLCETLIGFAIVTQMWALEAEAAFKRVGGLGLASLLITAAAFVRPNALALIVVAPAVLLLCTHLRRLERLLLSAVVAIVPISAVVSWTARNYAETGVNSFAAITAFDFYYFKVADVMSQLDSISFHAEQAKLQQEIGAASRSPWATNENQYREMWAKSTTLLRQHIFAYAVSWTENFAIQLVIPERQPFTVPSPGYAPGPVRARDYFRPFVIAPIRTGQKVYAQEFRSSVALLLVSLWQVAATAFELLGVFLAVKRGPAFWRSDRTGAIVLVGLPLVAALALLASSAGPETSARLRLPAVPLLIMLAAIGWSLSRPGARFWTSETSDFEASVADFTPPISVALCPLGRPGRVRR